MAASWRPRPPLSEGPGRALVRAGRGFEWAWAGSADDLERVLTAVARSAADLLTSAGLSRVRERAAGDCGWLFMDTSRNQSRRWCDMSACRQPRQARRYYARLKHRVAPPTR